MLWFESLAQVQDSTMGWDGVIRLDFIFLLSVRFMFLKFISMSIYVLERLNGYQNQSYLNFNWILSRLNSVFTVIYYIKFVFYVNHKLIDLQFNYASENLVWNWNFCLLQFFVQTVGGSLALASASADLNPILLVSSCTVEVASTG